MSTAPAYTELQEQIRRLAAQKHAAILAHNYEVPEVQDVADYVGDSLQLARQAAHTDADSIVFCGVHFMAETAAILNPQKKVLIPDPQAGCSLADTITADQLRAWKAERPGAVVVAYVNTSAEVKAETDICCTSSNAVKVVKSIPADQEILFCPDMFLGSYVKRVTGRSNMHIWMGECHVHAGIRPSQIEMLRASHPGSDMLIHPECGCVTQAMDFLSSGHIDAKQTYLLSTGGMLDHVAQSPQTDFVVVTETGILHRLQQKNPDKHFYPVNPEAVCRFMKMITLDKVLNSLQNDEFVVTVPDEIAQRARRAIDRMLAIG